MKKFKRLYEQLTGITLANATFPDTFNGKNWSVLKAALRNVKPSQRLSYYKDFRLFLREVKFETPFVSGANNEEV